MNIFYFIRINVFIFLAVIFTFPQSHSKPIPPGSGEGDVPANILFLLDSSLSMKNPVTGGTYLGLEGVNWAVELSDGNIIVGEKDDGVIKILTADNKKDTSFAKKVTLILEAHPQKIVIAQRVQEALKTHIQHTLPQVMFPQMIQFGLDHKEPEI